MRGVYEGVRTHYSPGRATTYLRELRPDGGTRISRVHGGNGANEINKSQREKAAEDGLRAVRNGERGGEECERAISRWWIRRENAAR